MHVAATAEVWGEPVRRARIEVGQETRESLHSEEDGVRAMQSIGGGSEGIPAKGLAKVVVPNQLRWCTRTTQVRVGLVLAVHEQERAGDKHTLKVG